MTASTAIQVAGQIGPIAMAANVGQLIHIAATCEASPSKTKIFYNGIKIAEGNYGRTNSGVNMFAIGCLSQGNAHNFLDADIFRLRVTNAVRYSDAFTPAPPESWVRS